MGIGIFQNSTANSFTSKNAMTALQEHKYFLIFAIMFYGLTFLVLQNTINLDGAVLVTSFLKFCFSALLFSIAPLAIFLVLKLLLKKTDENVFIYCGKMLRREIFSNKNVWRIIFGIIGFALVFSAFLELKPAIPVINPFSYDIAFEQLDRSIHFGYQPWELLQPLLGYQWVTLMIHKMYYLWFGIIFLTFYWQIGAQKDNPLRMQFILSFIACWAIIGGVMAVLFSSAGPIYFDQVVTGSPQTYASAMTYLEGINQESPLRMLEVKQTLWNVYTGVAIDGDVKGISAMPSMHVSIAFLLVLFGWRKSKAYGIAYSIFAMMILLGSIHLLWHYAIDGYVSIIATSIIWVVCGKVSHSFYADEESNTGSDEANSQLLA